MQRNSPRNSPPGKETRDARHETGGLPRRGAMANYAAAMDAVLSGVCDASGVAVRRRVRHALTAAPDARAHPGRSWNGAMIRCGNSRGAIRTISRHAPYPDHGVPGRRKLYTVITVALVVLRASRSRWARAASRNGYVCPIATFTLPASTIPNSSLADASRSSRLAV